jgi:DNA-binding MarR family transcriptional regulator/N-acetylglutamate synthase-like GNAT family acetyltransferase
MPTKAGRPLTTRPQADAHRWAQAVRRFNRFYTKQIGLLQEHLVRSPFSLAEARVLYELARREKPTAGELGGGLGLDPGYLSRILRGFRNRGLVKTEASKTDGRQAHLSLTPRGSRTFADLDARSEEQIVGLLGGLSEAGRRRLVEAMRTIEELLGSPGDGAHPLVLRAPLPGDLGWVVHRHGVLYAREYGYDARFEALVARIVAKFAENHDRKRERCWIAEQRGEIVGAVFLVKASAKVGRLRLFYVEPEARGQGIGARLVEECVRFARQVGFRKITLWTQNDLYAARHLYEKAGFRRVREERHRSFGQSLVAETWELVL